MIPLLLGVAALALAWWAAAPEAPRWRWAAPVVAVAAAVLTSGSFIIVEKTIGRLIMPTGALWALGYLVVLVSRRRGAKTSARWGLAFWLTLTVVGNHWLGGVLLGWLESDYITVKPSKMDAVWVLGGGTAESPAGGVQLGPSGDRVARAARLYHAGHTPLLVASGTAIAGLDQPEPRDLTEETATLWKQMGIPEAAIVQIRGSHNTRTEMQDLAREAPARGWQKVGLVTSGWHLRRAMAHAPSVQGVEIIPLGADWRGGPPTFSLAGLVPDGHGFYAVRLAAWELVGAAVGR